MRLWSIVFLVVAARLATGQISAPRVGLARYANGTVQAIYGLDANFVIRGQAISPADAISFSDSGGLVSRAGHIQLLGRDASVIAEYDSSEAAPVLNMDGDLTTAIAWLPSRHALLYWNGKSFVVAPLTSAISENVTSLRVQGGHSANLLLAGVDGNVLEATVSLESGNLISIDPLPGAKAPAFQQGAFVVFHDREGLEIQAADGALRTLPLPAGDLSIERMSSDWLHVASISMKRDWALHLSASALNLSQLPALNEAVK